MEQVEVSQNALDHQFANYKLMIISPFHLRFSSRSRMKERLVQKGKMRILLVFHFISNDRQLPSAPGRTSR